MDKRIIILIFLLVSVQSQSPNLFTMFRDAISGVGRFASELFGLAPRDNIPNQVKTWNCTTGPLSGKGRIMQIANGTVTIAGAKFRVAPCTRVFFAPGHRNISVGEIVKFTAFRSEQQYWIQQISADITTPVAMPKQTANQSQNGTVRVNATFRSNSTGKGPKLKVLGQNGKIYIPTGQRYIPGPDGGIIVKDPPPPVAN